MDIKERIAELLFDMDWDEENAYAMRNASSGVWAEQVNIFPRLHYIERAEKFLALFEPVTLEPLSDEEMAVILLTEDDIAELEQQATIGLAPFAHIEYIQHLELLCNERLKLKTSQATIAKYGQLYRIK